MRKLISYIEFVFILFWLLIQPCFAQTIFESLPIDTVIPMRDLPEFQTSLIFQSKLEDCRPLIKDLAYVKVRYWGFDDKEHHGALIVHASLGKEVVTIFKELFKHRFPIQAMHPIPDSLKNTPGIYDNVTGAYNCRYITNQPGILSQHSFGRAIDINPMQNPYVKKCIIIPEGSKKHSSRLFPEKGKILPNSLVAQLFAKYGWHWGGHFLEIEDYMHFEKKSPERSQTLFGYFITANTKFCPDDEPSRVKFTIKV